MAPSRKRQPRTPRGLKHYNFVVLPARGVIMSEENMAQAATVLGGANFRPLSSLFAEGRKSVPLEEIIDFLDRRVPTQLKMSDISTYVREKSRDRENAVELISQRTTDGPIAIRASAEVERLVRAAGYRVFRQQVYHLIAPTTHTVLGGATEEVLAPRTDMRAEFYHTPDYLNGGPRGDGVLIGVVDSGVDAAHPLLAHAVTGGRNLVDQEDPDDWGPSLGELGWHGTHVAGIIAARGSNGSCPEGIAPNARIRSYRVFGGANGRASSTQDIIEAILLATDDGCDLINLSLGGRALRDEGVRDAINYAWDQGVLCVAAAGNDGRRPVTFPAAYPNCVAVSAIGRVSLLLPETPRSILKGPPSKADPDVFVAAFSNIGPQIDFAGPGVDMISCIADGKVGASSGTSMAAPAVTGCAAVILSRSNDLLLGNRDKLRSAALFARLVSNARPFRLGSFDYEGYGVPL